MHMWWSVGKAKLNRSCNIAVQLLVQNKNFELANAWNETSICQKCLY